MNNMWWTIENTYIVLVIVQIVHSMEEIFTGFAKKWPVWRTSQREFVLFEIFFSVLIISVIFLKDFPFRNTFMAGFNVLMFANAIWHLMWAGTVKKYVP